MAQNREYATAVTAEKNTLLAGTLLLSSASSVFNIRNESGGGEGDDPDPLITRFSAELSECLSSTMTTKVAAGLSRSLLLLCTTSTAGHTEQAIASVLLPRLIAFIVLPCEAAGTDETRASVAHTLTTFVLALDPQKSFPSADDPSSQPVTIMQRSIALSLIIPALLRRARSEGPRTHKDTAMRLVEVAQEEPAGFREAVARLDGAEKEFLRGIVRQNEESDDEDEDGEGGGDLGQVGEGGAGPSIELKTDF